MSSAPVGDAVAGEGHADSLVQARLVVAADGAHSLVKQAAGIASSERDYQQVALVANIRTERSARGIAYERFSAAGRWRCCRWPTAAYTRGVDSGARAVRPRCSMPTTLNSARRCSTASAGARVRSLQVGRRASYPLSLVQAQRLTGQRVALIGNAAQALHPVAAQGFNLGLRDAAMLAELIATASDPGAQQLLSRFARAARAPTAAA